MVAAKHGMATDAVYVSRPHPETQILKQHTIDLPVSQDWDEDTLYVMAIDPGRRVALDIDTSRHLIVEIEGMLVLAPEWNDCEECQQMEPAG